MNQAASPVRSFWGWGVEQAALDPADIAIMAKQVLGEAIQPLDQPLPVPRLDTITLNASRVEPDPTLAALIRNDPRSRASHAYGKSFRDIVRGLAGDFTNAPGLVAYPETEADVAAVLDWCTNADLACIPYGGGTSVVGGVEPTLPRDYRGTVSLDLSRLNRLLDIDHSSRTAIFESGILGPDLENQLRTSGLTLRHFPQSFEFSTLGGWIATRAGGHYATMHTHIDDFVASLTVLTPTGRIESRRLPSSGAGPSPDRLFMGSEGALGVITSACVRLQERPRFKAATSAAFPGMLAAVPAARALAQSSLYPSNCRVLDPLEALITGAGDGTQAILLIGFESADHDVAGQMASAVELIRDHEPTEVSAVRLTRPGADSHRDERSDQWRQAFLAGPYLRDALVRLGLVAETFESAVTWDQFEAFHDSVMTTTQRVLNEVCGGGTVQCRFTHVYPDGVAPYYTVIGTGSPSGRVQQWDQIKAAASEAIIDAGGTITHHHAVGRDHRPWYDQQRPDGFASALQAVKADLDPAGVMNPGVLIDPL